MVKRTAGFISFVLACLILAPIVSADEGDVGRPHNNIPQSNEQQDFE